jgi:hypothetical protein
MLLVVAIGGALSLLGARDAAADSGVATRLVWDGSVCGSAQDFAARVGKRTNVARFVQRGQRLVVRARIARRGDGLEASASIEARGTEPVVRRLESADCDDALDALALVVAIGIEGRASAARASPRARRRLPPTEPAPAPVESAPEPPAPGAGEMPSEVPAPAPEPPPSDAAPEPAAPRVSEPLPQPPPPSEPPRRAPAPEPEIDSAFPAAPLPVDIGAGLSGALSVGVAPAPLFGGSLWVSIAWARDGVWAPELVVTAGHQRLGGLTRSEGQADFALSSAGASLCPLRLGDATFVLRPCVSGALGRLDVDGHSTFDPRSWQRPWRSVGGTLEGLVRAGAIEFRAVLGATAPLVRDSFAFEQPCPDSAVCEADVFHHVAPVVWSGALGAGIRIW